MNLAFIGYAAVVVLLVAILSKKVHPTVAFVVIPILAAIISGFNASEIVEFITKGVTGMAATGVMFLFSIAFFGIINDAGTFQPVVKQILKFTNSDPMRVTIGTALLGMLCHLDGSGATTFLIAIPPLIPLYDTLKMRRTTLATLVALAAGTMNIVPWGGPTLFAAAPLELEVSVLYNPLIIPQIVGLIAVLGIAVLLGRAERKNIGWTKDAPPAAVAEYEENLSEEEKALRRPKLLIVNWLIILAAVVILLSGKITPFIVFMVAFCLALVINYPKVSEQGERINAHAVDAMLMVSIMFASSVFTGILSNSGMITQMTEAFVSVMPDSFAPAFPIIIGILSTPMSLVFPTVAFYQGVLPLLANAAEAFGISGADIARAALLGQMTTGFPISPLTGATFLLIGLSGVSLADHQKKTFPWAWAVTIIMLIVALLIGSIAP